MLTSKSCLRFLNHRWADCGVGECRVSAGLSPSAQRGCDISRQKVGAMMGFFEQFFLRFQLIRAAALHYTCRPSHAVHYRMSNKD